MADDKKITGGSPLARFEELQKVSEKFTQEALQKIDKLNAKLKSKIDEIDRHQNALNAAETVRPEVLAAIGGDSPSTILQKVSIASLAKESIEGQLSDAMRSHNVGLSKMMNSGMRSVLRSSGMSSDISSAASSISMMSPSISKARSSTTYQLEQEKFRNISDIQGLLGRAKTIDINAPEGKQEMVGVLAEIEQKQQAAALASASMKQQGKLGLDTGGILDRGRAYLSRIEEDKMKHDIRREVSSGSHKDRKKVEEELASTADKLRKALEELEGAADKATVAQHQNIQQLEEEHRQKKAIRDEMDRQGVGGGGIGKGIGAVGAFMSGLGNVLGGVASVTRFSEVTSEMMNTQNRIGFANLANKRFDDMMAASRDGGAARRFMTNANDRAMRSGEFMGKAEQTARIEEAAGGGASAIGTIAQSTAKGIMGSKNLLGAVVGAVSGVADASPEIANTINASIDIDKNLSRNAVTIQRTQQEIELEDARNYIADRGVTLALGHKRSLTLATRGLGRGREGAQSSLQDPATLQRLAEAGLDVNDIPSLVNMAKSGFGGSFNGERDLRRAQDLARTGTMQSPEQYFQARAQMANAGGGANNFEEILKNAVTNGMDNSKNIMQMVDATTALASRSAQMGINTFGAAAQMIGAGTNALVSQGVPKDMAANAALIAAQDINQKSASSQLTLPNVIEMQKLRNLAPKADTAGLQFLQNMSLEEARALKQTMGSGTANQIKAMEKSLGVFGLVDKTNIDTLIEAKTTKTVQSTTGMLLDPKKTQAIAEKLYRGQKLTDEEENFFQGSLHSQGKSGVAEEGILSNGRAVRIGGGGAGGEQAAKDENLNRADALNSARLFKEGVDSFTKAMGTFKDFGDNYLKRSSAMGPEEFAKQTKAAADTFTIPAAKTLQSAADKFDTAVDKFIRANNGNIAAGIKNNADPTQSRKVGTPPK